MCEFCEDKRFSRRRLLRGIAASLALAGIPMSWLRAAEAGFQTDAVAVYHPPGFAFEEAPDSIEEEWSDIEEYFQAYHTAMRGPPKADLYGLAVANQVLGLIVNNPDYIKRAGGLYQLHAQSSGSDKERDCALAGMRYCAQILTGAFAPGTEFKGAVSRPVVSRIPPPASPFKTIVLGNSSIQVTSASHIKTQVDRVTRDWLLAFQPSGVPWSSRSGRFFGSHEGARLADIVKFSAAKVTPVWGLTAQKIGESWYAPDASGAPAFEMSPDKVREYPSGILLDTHTAIVNDTHGISALAWDAGDATLVVGCGDHRGKMDAAYYLAKRGIDVYVPTDRLLGQLIGADTKGTIVGSAPVKPNALGAEIGNQPVAIGMDELIVVSYAAPVYPLQYYDTPLRYFRALGEYLGRPFRLMAVAVEEYGYAVPVVEAARDRGANVIGIRIKSQKEHDAVAAWLRESGSHRAILFHTAAYKEGYSLFAQFPDQTSFGDIHPEYRM